MTLLLYVALSRYMSNQNVLYINYYKRVAVRVKVMLGLRIYIEKAPYMCNNEVLFKANIGVLYHI